ncbi:YqcC family protein [Marinobacter sp.]|uniref:YqcC family protein n=1 Tax=Marinobacter sp. TaxID=50741 RepID=UPI001A053072|nr:YqcC family protein [Marinobacter sp.]MBE0485219.1 YqcC family protein [Marinobacter sp.]
MTTRERHLDRVTDSLLQIEIELRRLDVWASVSPPEAAFQSAEPFCLDTMSFPQWLQFVFLQKMKVLIESGHPLPSVSGIAPMAEEYFRGQQLSGRGLVQALEEMDRLLSGA